MLGGRNEVHTAASSRTGVTRDGEKFIRPVYHKRACVGSVLAKFTYLTGLVRFAGQSGNRLLPLELSAAGLVPKVNGRLKQIWRFYR